MKGFKMKTIFSLCRTGQCLIKSKTIYRHGIMELHRFFPFTTFIPVNPVYFKLIILSTQYALRASSHGDFFENFSTFCVNVRILVNRIENGIQNTEDRITG